MGEAVTGETTRATVTISVETAGVQVAGIAASPTLLTWRWLRDHGEDTVSFNQDTRQRRINILQATEIAAATSASVGTVDGQAVIELRWPDAPETTWISVGTLERLIGTALSDDPGPVSLWDRPIEAALTSGTVDAVLGDDSALRSWLADLRRYGVGRLAGYDGTEAQAEALARRIGYPRRTIFGTMWELASDITHHDDTAYTHEFLAPHTDGTYCHDAPGLQMFSCVERDGDGGESVIVDAFAIASGLRSSHPDLFDILSSVPVPCHYIEPGVELRAARPVIGLTPTGDLRQVSVNTYDRSPMLLPEPDMDRFYQAYGAFDRLANDPSRWMKIRLEAGDVLAVDNWRCLHGRMGYSGARRFYGCYLNHEDLESRWRLLGLA